MKIDIKFLWEKFNPLVYIQNNYSYIHDEDKEIIKILVEFYNSLPYLKKSVEIGCGPNIYPLMLALSKINSIEIVEYSARNINYLQNQIKNLDKNWFLFWDFITSLDSKRENINLVDSLRNKVKIEQSSIYNLSKNKFDLASMFFCAESITDDKNEFISVCRKFVDCVKTNGYLVAAFMENSKGYSISGIKFPSISISQKDLKQVFKNNVNDLKIHRIPKQIKH